MQMQHVQAQQQRHGEVVAHHGGKRDGFDDHHAGCRGEPADERRECQQRLLLRDRQVQHEGIGIDVAGRKMHQPGKRDRQHENVDDEQIKRKQPHRLVEMTFVDVFNHCDLELARQEHDCEHGQEGERCPRRVIDGVAAEVE